MAAAKTKTTVTKSAAAPKSKTSAAKKATPGKKQPAKAQKSSGDDDAKYTKPELRERIKAKVKQGAKGGRPGEWSARKAQLVASEYKEEGGAYKEGGPSDSQKHLQSWTDEKWQTASGKKAIQGKTTSRYLPQKAWDQLTPAEKKATDEKKQRASGKGKQFVANTPAAKKARKSATK